MSRNYGALDHKAVVVKLMRSVQIYPEVNQQDFLVDWRWGMKERGESRLTAIFDI